MELERQRKRKSRLLPLAVVIVALIGLMMYFKPTEDDFVLYLIGNTEGESSLVQFGTEVLTGPLKALTTSEDWVVARKFTIGALGEQAVYLGLPGKFFYRLE
ncbi:hypothetical protein [Paenibacillus daejeonensis]|uniref:hypothetical protein n=1 Tax=Paenibacillus daejeonensis TaxID=135193 RepID=UPI0003697E0D|nr:hypothetical protein [Paenibacillus daejeonensis]